MYILQKRDTHPTNPKVSKLATVSVDSTDTSKGKQHDIEVSITFSGTEIRFAAIDCDSGNEVNTTIDYI